MDFEFEWDEQKAQTNTQKHGISFQEATTVFEDPFLITFQDDLHSVYEDRFISIGTSISMRLLTVIHTECDERIRIISARLATRREHYTYEHG
ncbi:BrnT family toxin [Candidatus Chloroploca sp. Khr17]|uniref:BrnT family toxin n=1 Tax=Candidatus Chloroploca sp. Khr17 TaxID=2496869 RepID=UPI00101D1210|nr:BrnT family toxin [Candidatus Chloroploca sp. Khr17]